MEEINLVELEFVGPLNFGKKSMMTILCAGWQL